MRSTCHHFLFSLLKRNHFVFKKPELVPLEPGAEAEKPKTLFETLQEARKMLEKAKEKIDLVENYYKGKTMPKELKKALDEFKKITKELEQVVLKRSKAQGEWEGKGAEKKQVKTEQEIIEDMMASMDSIFGNVRERNEEATKVAEKDPMDSTIDYLSIDETTLRPPKKPKLQGVPLLDDTEEPSDQGKKSQAKAKAAPVEAKPQPKPVAEKVVAKNSPEYWNMMAHSVVRKIFQKMDSGVDPGPLLSDERQAVMFLADPGKTRNFDYHDGDKVTRVILERDLTGKYLRIRNDKPGTPAQKSEAQNNSIMAFPTTAGAKWPNETPVETADEKIDRRKNDLGKKLDWLASSKVPYGSRISIGQTISTEQLEDGGQLVKKYWMTIVKESGGAYRVETYVQDIEKNKKGSGKPLVQGGPKQNELVRTFGTPADARAYLEGFLREDASLVAMEATPSDKAAEDKLAEEKRFEKLEKLSGNLMRFAIFGLDEDGPRKKSEGYIKTMQDVCDYLAKNNIQNWESKKDFLNFHLKVENGYVNLLQKNRVVGGKKPAEPYTVADRAFIPQIEGNKKVA